MDEKAKKEDARRQKPDEKEAKPAPEAERKDKGKHAPKEPRATTIVRLAGRDLNGDLPLSRAVLGIKGMGTAFGKTVADIATADLKLSPEVNLGSLTEQQVERLEYIMAHPHEFGVPKFLLNRRKDFASGENIHLIGTDLSFTVKQDIDHEKDIVSWKGFRHSYGQKVRGQHTRSTGRTGMSVGVLRKAVLAKAGAAAAAQTGAQAQAAAAAPAAGGKGAPAPAAAGGKGGAAAAPAAKAAPAAAPKAAAPAGKEKK